MTDRQIQRLASYQRISNHFSDHADEWASEPVVGEVVTEWDGLLAGIREQRNKQALDTTGATRTKDQQVDHVIALTMTVAKRLRSYARLRDDAGLLPVVDVNETELDRMNDVDMVAEVAAITTAARQRPEDALAPFKVTPALLDELDAEAAKILPAEDRQDAAGDERAVATAELSRLFAAFPPLRDVLDDLVDSLIEDEAFRAGYYQARKVYG